MLHEPHKAAVLRLPSLLALLPARQQHGYASGSWQASGQGQHQMLNQVKVCFKVVISKLEPKATSYVDKLQGNAANWRWIAMNALTC